MALENPKEFIDNAAKKIAEILSWKISDRINPDALRVSEVMAIAYAASKYAESVKPGFFDGPIKQNEMAFKQALKGSGINVPDKAFTEFDDAITAMLPQQKAKA